MNVLSLKCPGCGANIDFNGHNRNVKCDYCHQTITIDDENHMVLQGKVSVNGIETNDELIESANELLEMNEFLKAKKKYLEYSEKCPDDAKGWIGLLKCRTRNFTVKDNNIIFEKDVNKYYQHFLSTAPQEMKNIYVPVIERYLHPESYQTVKATKTKNTMQYKEMSASTKQTLILLLGILLVLTNFAPTCGFFLLMYLLFRSKKVCDSLKLNEKDAKTIDRVMIVASVLGFFFVDIANML